MFWGIFIYLFFKNCNQETFFYVLRNFSHFPVQNCSGVNKQFNPLPKGGRKAKSKLTNKHTEFQSGAHLLRYVNGNQCEETRFFKKT